MTIALHVDDLMITNVHEYNIESFYQYLRKVYKETKIVRGQALDYCEVAVPVEASAS